MDKYWMGWSEMEVGRGGCAPDVFVLVSSGIDGGGDLETDRGLGEGEGL